MLAGMANHVAQKISRAGVVPTYFAAAASDTFTPGDLVFLHVKNASASPVTLTVVTTPSEGGFAVADEVNVIAVGESVIGPFPPELFANVADGFAHFSWSATTTVTLAVLSL
jgi:hypothetical protein